MEKGKDIRTTFRLKREANLTTLQTQVFDAQKELETLCESTMTARKQTIIFLSKENDPCSKVLQDISDIYNYSLELVHTEFDLFQEVGKNNISAIVIQIENICHHESTVSSLKKRKIPVFVVHERGDGEKYLDLWVKAYGQHYQWPDDLGHLVSAITALWNSE